MKGLYMSFRNIDGLMQHLRENGIAISGSAEKRQLRNFGYYHGYKGYRFFITSNKRIPFTKYAEISATIKFDSQLKALFYDKIMFIETAVKNIALECILKEANSENIQDMYNKVVCGYHDCPVGSDQNTKKKAQENKLKLENIIQSYLSKAYKNNNPKITHFYNNLGYSGVPLWALFEIFTMGDFGFLLSCLNFTTRDAISKAIGLDDIAIDTNRELIYKYIYTIKDLRNAIAHNAVVFDTRFKKMDPSPAMRTYLQQNLSLSYVNFKTIGDYLFLVCYYLKLLGVAKTEIKAFLRDFQRIISDYKNSVSEQVYSMVIHTDLVSRVETVKRII